MPIRQFRPVTASSRFRSIPDFSEITREEPEKSLVEPLKKSGGRDNHGHISMRRRGGGHKRKYRIIDFRRDKFGVTATVKEIESTALAKVKQWQPMFKDNIPLKPIVPEPMQGSTLRLEGQKLEILGEQQGDTPDSSFVYIPSLSAVVCGDIVYSGVFPWTAESTAEQRKAWLKTLDGIAALNPKVVVPGHERPEGGTTPASLAFMKSYLKSYDEVLAASKTAADAESKLKAQYPNLGSDFSLKLALQLAYRH
jgi:glyoxylase-like metal-dependent hydrolase (beta-lactamase superfamily II)